MNKIRLLTLSTLLPALHANAGEVAPGDYEQYPVGATIGAIYYQHATTDSAYANGHKASSDFRVTSDVGTTNVRLTATKFVTPTDQVQLQLGKDLSVDNGTREDFRMNLRYAHIF